MRRTAPANKFQSSLDEMGINDAQLARRVSLETFSSSCGFESLRIRNKYWLRCVSNISIHAATAFSSSYLSIANKNPHHLLSMTRCNAFHFLSPPKAERGQASLKPCHVLRTSLRAALTGRWAICRPQASFSGGASRTGELRVSQRCRQQQGRQSPGG